MLHVSEGLPLQFRPTRTREAVCPVHGPYTAKHVPVLSEDPWTGCPKCEEERRAKNWALDNRQAMTEIRQKQVEQDMGRAAIPPRFTFKTLDTFRVETEKQAKVLQACREYLAAWEQVQKQGRCLLLLGAPGTGKTHLAVGITHAVLAMGKTAVYTRASNIFREIKETYSNHEKSEKQIYLQYRQPDLLVIDEIGRQYRSEAEKIMLWEVINDRYEACKPAVIVSNMGPNDFSEYLGQAAFSRLIEDGGKVICFDGANMRYERG